MVARSNTTGVRQDDPFLRYQKTWRIADLDNAITNAKAELKSVGSSNDRRRAALLNDLGCYYQERYFRSDYDFNQKCSISDLQEGVAFAEQAVRLTRFLDPLSATHKANLANLLLTLWEEDPDSTESDLKRAVEMSESAVRESRPDSADVCLHHIQLAKALQRKALAYKISSHFRQAIEHATKAERAVGVKHPKRGLVLSEIAEIYHGKIQNGRRPEKLSAGTRICCACLRGHSAGLRGSRQDFYYIGANDEPLKDVAIEPYGA